MKINKINSENVVLFKHKSHAKTHTDSITQNINNQIDKTPNNPKYYQAINNISFQSNLHYLAVPKRNKSNETTEIKVRIPLEDKDNVVFTLSAEEAKLFLNEHGEFENDKLAVFVELFEEFFKLRKSKHEKEKGILQKILNKKEDNVSSINVENDVRRAMHYADFENDEDFLENFLTNIKDEKERKYLAKIYLENIEKQLILDTVQAAKEAICVLKLSKNSYGFDLSQLPEKINIAVHLEYINSQNQTDYTDTFVNSITTNGKTDLELGKKLIGFMQLDSENGLSKESIENYAQTIKRMTQKINPFQPD